MMILKGRAFIQMTLKEGLLIKNMIGYYMTNNNLYYDNNEEVLTIINKINTSNASKIPNDRVLKDARKDAKKVLKKHYYERLAKDICGVK